MLACLVFHVCALHVERFIQFMAATCFRSHLTWPSIVVVVVYLIERENVVSAQQAAQESHIYKLQHKLSAST